MIDYNNSTIGTQKQYCQYDSRPDSSTTQIGKTFSSQNSQSLTKSMKELKQEIKQIEKKMKAPYNNKAFQYHSNMSYSKGIIHKFPINIAYDYGNTKKFEKKSQLNSYSVNECTTPTKRYDNTETLRQINRGEDNEINTLIDAKETFVREKQQEIYKANEEFSKLMVEAQRIKRDENSLKLKRVELHNRNYERQLELTRQQFELSVSILQQQLKDNIEAEEVTTRTNIKTKITLLEKNSAFSKVDNVLYSKLTPSKINKLYDNSYSPYKQEKEDSIQMKQNLFNSNEYLYRNQVGRDTNLYNSNQKANNLKNQTYPLDSALFASQSENRLKNNNNMVKSKTITNHHDNEDYYLENRFFSNSPSYAQIQIDKLQRDIRHLQQSNKEKYYQNSGSKVKTIQRSPHSSFSPAQKIYLVKARKKICVDNIYNSSSSEDEKKFLSDYKKHKELYELKEKFKSNHIKDNIQNSKKKD